MIAVHLLTIGLNYKTAPIHIREKFTFPQEAVLSAHRALNDQKGILECVILSTCNRTELYVVCDQLHTGPHYVKTFLEEWFSISRAEFNDYLYSMEEERVVRHLFNVACGLDSMVLGETQILGQVRQAMELAQEAGTTGTVLNRLFLQAVTVGKKAHRETEIGQHAVSVSYAAVELGKKIFGDFSGKTVLILGAGKMGELTAKHLHANGAKKVLVVNRTQKNALELAERFSGKAYAFSELAIPLKQADVVIASTGAENPVLTRQHVAQAMAKRLNRPMFLIDIAVPRDVEESVNEIENVFLYDIDDLQGIVDANLAERRKAAEKVREFVMDEVDKFNEWLETLGVVPLITALREKALAVQAETMERIERKLPDLTERELRIIRKQTKSIVNQLLRDPIARIKELAAEPEGREALELFEKIFALEAQLVEIESRNNVVREKETATHTIPIKKVAIRA